MKKKYVKYCIYALVTIFLVLVFPLFFQMNPDIVFIWNIFSLLVISVNIFFVITEEKDKKMKHTKISLFFLLSLIMANKLYSYNYIISIFPILKSIPKDFMFIAGILFVLISALFGVFYKLYTYYYQKDLKPLANNDTINSDTINSNSKITDNDIKHESGHSKMIQNNSKKGQTTQINQNQNQTEPRFIHFLSILIMCIIVVALALTIMYTLQNNKGFWLELTNSEQIPEFAINFAIGIGILIAFIFAILIMASYFIQLLYKIILGIFKKQQLSFQNDSFLKCVSLFLGLFCFFIYRKADIKDLFSLLNGSNKTVSLLMIIVTFTIIAFITLIIYKILKSFIKPNGLLRFYTDKIFNLTVETVGKIVINILERLSKVPDLLDPLLDATKKSFTEIKEILFDDD